MDREIFLGGLEGGPLLRCLGRSEQAINLLEDRCLGAPQLTDKGSQIGFLGEGPSQIVDLGCQLGDVGGGLREIILQLVQLQGDNVEHIKQRMQVCPALFRLGQGRR